MTKIMLVDDDESMRLLIGQIVRRDGYDFCCADCGEAGLAMLRAERPDFLILDVMLPDTNGFEICQTIRAEGRKVPIMFLTAKGDIVDKSIGFKAGADDYLVKPFQPEELSLRLQAQRKLLGLEGLHQIVVRAGLEADALVHDVALGRQEHDGHLAPLGTDGLADLEAVRVGQHDVQDEEVGALGAQHGKPRLAAVGAAEVVAVAPDNLPYEQPHAFVVVHQHDLRHDASFPSPAALAPEGALPPAASGPSVPPCASASQPRRGRRAASSPSSPPTPPMPPAGASAPPPAPGGAASARPSCGSAGASGAFTGSSTRNVLPRPTSLSTSTEPPSMPTRSFTSESPSPLPP